MDDDPTTDDGSDREQTSSQIAPRRSRWWAIAAAAAAAAFVASVVASTNSASVPVGASGSMPGMSMSPGQLMATMKDVSDRTVRLPGGRAGVVVFAEARLCDGCAAAVRATRDALRTTAPRASFVVLMTDSNTSRSDVGRFDRAAGRPPARYVIDDRNGTLASTLGATGLPGALVYDARGRVIARPEPSSQQMVAALRQVTR